MEIIVKTLFGLEEILAKELKALGAENIQKLSRAVLCEGDMALLYRINIESRLALRVLMPIDTFDVQDEQELYRKIKRVNWQRHFTNEVTIAVDGHSSSDLFTHSKYIALKAKDAIVDQFREMTGTRQNVELNQPDIRVNIHIRGNICTVSLDSSGESLHKRGYRTDAVFAPINEVLAAGMISLSEWKCDSDFYDPMCGSGTIAIEAAFYAYGIPPNINRNYFSFKNWKNFDQDLWDMVKTTALEKKRDFKHNIYASDIDYRAIEKTRNNIENAGFTDEIEVQEVDFNELKPHSETGLIMINPPYDERLEIDNVKDFYKWMSDVLKQNFSDHDAWIISSNLDAIKYFGLRPSRKIALFNGPLECKFLKYALYRGTKKIHKLLDEDGNVDPEKTKRKRMTISPPRRRPNKVKIPRSFEDRMGKTRERRTEIQEETTTNPLASRIAKSTARKTEIKEESTTSNPLASRIAKSKEKKSDIKEETTANSLENRIEKSKEKQVEIKKDDTSKDEVTPKKNSLLSRISKKKDE